MDLLFVLEWSAVLLNFTYVILAARQKAACWPFGIVGSALSIWFFYLIGLYAEAMLFIYYVLMGFYGWWAWTKGSAGKPELPISTWRVPRHLLIILLGSGVAVLLGFVLDNFTEAKSAYFDAFTTIFSFVATWLTTRKVLENWTYWIIIDLFTIWLYASKGAHVYAGLSVVYTAMAVYGFVEWRKRRRTSDLSPSVS